MENSLIEHEGMHKSEMAEVSHKHKKGGLFKGIKGLFSRFNHDDLLLVGILLLLLEEEIDDEFLILIIGFLILTGNE